MRINYKSFVFTILILSIAISAKTIKVPEEFPSIQSAINESVDGDTVLVAPGEYFENINYKGRNIVLASHIILESDGSFIESTIINGSSPANNDTASCVLFISGETRGAVLEGFTITGGTGTFWTDERGAGRYIEGEGILSALSSPTIRSNIIENNSVLRVDRDAVSTGGGTHDVAGNGGGALLWGSGVIFKNNIVWGNTQTEDGGLYEYSSRRVTDVSYNDIEENYEGTGNISVDPLFEGDTYLLSDDSPCIDAGDPGEMFFDKPDATNGEFAMCPSKGTRINDQGVYGGPNVLIIPGASTGIPAEQDGRPAETYNILQNYPNPFNPITTFEFGLAKKAEVFLVVYDANGRRVANVLDQSMSEGIHRIVLIRAIFQAEFMRLF